MYPLLDHEERMGVHLPDLLPPRRPGGLNTINRLPGRKSSGEPARLSEMPLPGIHRKLTQKPSFSACDGVCFMVYCKNAEQVSETVKRLRDLPSSERKIVTKETHQGCLSFAIIGFWDFLSSKNRTQNEKIVFSFCDFCPEAARLGAVFLTEGDQDGLKQQKRRKQRRKQEEQP